MGKDLLKIEYSIIKRYMDDITTEDENILLEKWLEDLGDGFKGEKYIHLLWNDFEPEEKEDEIDFDALLDKIHHQIQLRNGKPKKFKIISNALKYRTFHVQIMRNLGRVAAIFLIPVLSYIAWEIFNENMWMKNQNELVYNEIKAPLGAQSKFVLPDGTKGNLNNGSVLRYPVRFSGNTREVDLQGEAYFDVKHVKGRPFIINTNGLDVKVLGTKLNVYSYPDEEYQEVTLESGSVELIQPNKEQEKIVARMVPKQQVIYKFGQTTKESGKHKMNKDLIVIHNAEQMDKITSQLKSGQKAFLSTEKGDLYLGYVKTDKYTGWKDGKLILKNDPMPVLLKRVERWYGVKFNIKDERINEYTYWATFQDENLEQVLKLLSLSGPLKFTMLPREKMEDGTFKTQEIDISIK